MGGYGGSWGPGFLALVVRWVYWNQVHEFSLYQTPTGDAATYIGMAADITNNGFLAPRGAPYQQAPLYGWFLAVLNNLGATLGGVRWVQYLLGTGLVLMVGIIGRRWGGSRAGIASAFLGALYGPWVFFEGELLSVSLAIFLLMGGLLLLERLPLLAGLSLGLAALTQPTIGAAAIAITALGIWKPSLLRFSARRSAILLLSGLCIPLALTLARNISEVREPVVVSINGGINYFIGNNKAAPGIFHLPDDSGLINRPDGLFTSAKEVAEARAGHSLTSREVDRSWWLHGVDFWTTHPGAALTLWVRKVVLSLNHFEIPNHFDYGYMKTRAPILRLLPAWGILFPLALGGLFLMWRRGQAAPLLWFVALTCFVVMFFVTARYRLPLTVILVPAAGVFLAFLWESRNQLTRLLPGPALTLLVGVVIAWIPVVAGSSVSTAHMLNLEGISLAARGDLVGAEQAFRRVLELNPSHAEALNNTGRMMVLQGRDTEALGLYRQALNADPIQAETYFNLEELYRRSGQPEDAKVILDRLETARSGRVEDIAYGLAYRRGLVAIALGDSASADHYLSQAIVLDPNQQAASTSLTQLRQRGVPSAASPEVLEAARQAAAEDPSDADALLKYGRLLASSGRHQEAIKVLISGWQKRPKDPEPLLDIGASYLAIGDSLQAAAHWYKANENRIHPPSLLALAALMEAQGKQDAALAAYKILIVQTKGSPEAKTAAQRTRQLTGGRTP